MSHTDSWNSSHSRLRRALTALPLPGVWLTFSLLETPIHIWKKHAIIVWQGFQNINHVDVNLRSLQAPINPNWKHLIKSTVKLCPSSCTSIVLLIVRINWLVAACLRLLVIWCEGLQARTVTRSQRNFEYFLTPNQRNVATQSDWAAVNSSTPSGAHQLYWLLYACSLLAQDYLPILASSISRRFTHSTEPHGV